MTLSFSSPILLGGVIATSTLFFYILDTHLVRKKIQEKLFKLKERRK